MFKQWLTENKISEISFSNRLFPKACDRAFWEKSVDEIYVKYAEDHLGCEWPAIKASHYIAYDKNGDRLAQETPHFKRRLSLLTLFAGELKEHKGRFLPDICDGIFAICEETFWGLSAHIQQSLPALVLPHFGDQYIDLNAAETGELISVIYHVMYNEIKDYCPELLTRMEYELDRRIIKPYLTHTDFRWMGYTSPKVNNWNPWIISNVLTVFLTLPLDRDTLNQGIEKMMTEIQYYYNGMPDDGGCDEGCTYWTAAGAKLFAFCDQLYIASDGKICFFHDEKLRNIMHYEIKGYIGNSCFVNYGDGNSKINFNFNLLYALYGYGQRVNERSYCELAGTLLRNVTPEDKNMPPKGSSMKSFLFFLTFAKEMATQSEYKAEESFFLTDLQQMFARDGAWFCAQKGGHNKESHNHNDVGNFIVYHNADPVIMDCGCGTYTKDTFSSRRYEIWTMQSGYHNVPVVNGVEQLNGREFCADSFATDGKTAKISFAKAYPETAGIQDLTRTTTVTASGVTIRDAFTFENETNTLEEHFMTLLKPEITQEGVVLGGKYLLKTTLPYKIEWKDFEGDPKMIKAWDTNGVYRIVLTHDCGKNTALEFEVRSLQL